MGCSTSKSSSSRHPQGRQLLDHYKVGELLGQGTFGVVYACSRYGSDKAFAVKCVDKVLASEDSIEREAAILQKMKHPNITICVDVFYEKCFVCIVMDRFHGGTLITAMRAYWKSKGMIPLHITSLIVGQMASSLNYLHLTHFVHRDVKGDNFLCDFPEIDHSDLRVVLTDFGTACECAPGTRLNKKCGTKLYWSPEVYSQDYSAKVDIWALGVVFYGLLTGRFPFQDEHEVRTKALNLSVDIPAEGANLLLTTLHKEEDSRISADEIITHNFLHKDINGSLGSGDCDNSAGSSSDSAFIDVPCEVVVNSEIGARGSIVHRSQDLLQRLQDVHMKVRSSRHSISTAASRGSTNLDVQYWKPKFTVKAPRQQSLVVYEWWDAHKVSTVLGVHPVAGTGSIVDMNGEKAVLAEVIGNMLTDHSVDITKFGQSQAKTLFELASEIRHGSAVLMLDAASHKKVVRVVNVVCLRIRASRGSNKILIETDEPGADSCKSSISRLPQKEKEPHENSRQTAEKIMKEIPASKLKVTFDLMVKETYEEEEESSLYPGIFTVYRKEIIEGIASSSDAPRISNISGLSSLVGSNNASFQRSNASFQRDSNISDACRSNMSGAMSGVRTSNMSGFCTESSSYGVGMSCPGQKAEHGKGSIASGARHSNMSWLTGSVKMDANHNGKTFKWMTERQCDFRGIKFKAPQEGMEVSSLVLTPIAVDKQLLEEAISRSTSTSDLEVDQAELIAELSGEMERGECTLAVDKEGAFVRVVDLVVLKIGHPDGRILVEVEHLHADGTKTVLKRLPSAKRRPDENQFLAAWRVLKNSVKIEEESVHMLNNDDVDIIQEESSSPVYPQLRTICHQRIIPVQLMSSATNFPVMSASSIAGSTQVAPDENLRRVSEEFVGPPVILGSTQNYGVKNRESELTDAMSVIPSLRQESDSAVAEDKSRCLQFESSYTGLY